MTVEDRVGYLFLSLLQARVGMSVVSRLGDLAPGEVLRMSSEEFGGRVRLTEKGRRSFEDVRRSFDPDALLAHLEERGLHAVTLADDDYPEGLVEIPDPPPALFVNGEVPKALAFALVGSRKASVTGLDTARTLGRALGGRGVCVVSGLALGIDAAVHEGALEAGGPTLGVLGCGIDVVYPRSHRILYERVANAGALVSEYYLGEPPLHWHFPARNRVIAGLSRGLVVVEAAEKSGALITARHALDAGRDVWAVPGPIGHLECRGSNALLADGAGVLWDIDTFIEAVAPPADTSSESAAAVTIPEELPENEARVLMEVGFEPTGVDVVAGRCGIEMRELLGTLAMLELKGYVTRDSGGAFTRRPVAGGVQ